MGHQKINRHLPDEMDINGFIFSPIKTTVTFIFILLTAGLFLILLTWRVEIKLRCMYTQVPLRKAKKVLLKDEFGQQFEEDVVTQKCASGERSYFVNQKITYIWNGSGSGFVKQKSIDCNMRIGDFYKNKTGLASGVVTERLQEFGENVIKVSVPPIIHLVFHEALNPFYLFQAYTVVLWSIQMYWKFAVIIAITSVISVTASVWETRKQNRNLRDKMKSESTEIVLRNGEETTLSSVDLVPGDVMILPVEKCGGGHILQCDAVLIEGSVVVNESMLTGESIPITKVPLAVDGGAETNDQLFKSDEQRLNIIFCGTELLQGKAQYKGNCKAVVIRTGFMTAKGELVRAILFPPPLDFKFHRDFLKSLYVFLVLGLIGMSYSLYMWIKNGGTVAECILNSLDILTFVVPPILPAALTANNAFAQKRLQKKGIFCLHSKHICLCGGIDIVAFDKTGTLTDSDLDLAGVCPVWNNCLSESVPDPLTLQHDCNLIQAMATCHSIIKIKHVLTGNPLDVKLFEAIQWDLKENEQAEENPDYGGLVTPTLVSPPKNKFRTSKNGSCIKIENSNLEIAILKTYPFESALQRMTVITRIKGASHFNVFVKGAPEIVNSLCIPESVPANFNSNLIKFTRQGYRVIATASKRLESGPTWCYIDSMPRSVIEDQLIFGGLIIMRNLVKPETYKAIKCLHDANINTIMVTGDNLLTAMNVGRDCHLLTSNQTLVRVEAQIIQDDSGFFHRLNVSYSLEQQEPEHQQEPNLVNPIEMLLEKLNYVFACDGETFKLIRNNDKALFNRIVQRGKIFARMLPEQKIYLVECLKELGRQVIMCGDGCNDCGALKTAHAGISLSMAEASVAAPFTSKTMNIGCVPYLIREGRATMVSAFAAFKFGVAFAFTQLISVLMVFYIGTEPSDNQYLVVDIGLAALPIMMLGNCGPYDSLVKQYPTRHLLSFLPLFSIISYLLIISLAYISIWSYIRTQPWFVKYEFEAGLWPPNPSYEQTYIYHMACASAITAAIIYSKGAPYRKPLYTNGIMAVWSVVSVSTVIFMTLFRSDDFAKRMNFRISPSIEFRITMVGGILFIFCFTYAWEVFFLDIILFRYVLPWYKTRIRGPHLPFQRLEEELRKKTGWPPIGDYKNSETKIDMRSQLQGLKEDGTSKAELHQNSVCIKNSRNKDVREENFQLLEDNDVEQQMVKSASERWCRGKQVPTPTRSMSDRLQNSYESSITSLQNSSQRLAESVLNQQLIMASKKETIC